MRMKSLYMAVLFISPTCMALSAGEHHENTKLTHVILSIL